MMTRVSVVRSAPWIGRVVAVWALAVAIPMAAVGAERVVLGEEFTATW